MKLLFLLLFILASCLSRGQDGYDLRFQIADLKDTTVYLGYYYGESTFRRDTAKTDKEGHFRFSKPKRLERGVYFLILNRSEKVQVKLFEPGFLVSQDQHFSLVTSGPDYIRNMKVAGDEDNRLFFMNMIYNAERHKEAEPYVKVLGDSTLNEDQKKDARIAYNIIDKKVQEYQDAVIVKSPLSLTAKLLRVNRRIDVPPPPKNADGTIDSTWQYRYYRKHFFDNFDLTDDALIRLPTPLYQQKLEEYLDKLVLQAPDSLMAAIDELALRVKANKETYKYLVYNCVYKYQRPGIMGLDEVFVRLVDKYFVTGEMDYWATAAMKKSLKDHANKLRNSLVGKTGANLIMQDQYFQRQELYNIRNKYSVIFFFDPDCGHCKEESPKLVSFYNSSKSKFNLEIFAVSLDTSMLKMRNYIKEMKFTWTTVNGPRSYSGSLHDHYYAETTPMVYILDQKRKIIAKGLSVERLEDFLTNYEQFELRRSASAKTKGGQD